MADSVCWNGCRVAIRRTSDQARAFFLQARSNRFQHAFSTSSKRHVQPAPLESSASRSAQAYCTNLVLKYDSPSYTLSHFVKPHMLPAYFAIRAFNIEISRIPDIVSNTAIGQMRHQFWRDTINKTFDANPPEEPVAVLLAAYMHDTGIKLNKAWFQRIINARDDALARPGFTNVAALDSYAEATYSTLLYLSLSAQPLNSVAVDHIASHVGKAAGIAAILRGVPLLAFPPPPNTHNANAPGTPGGRDRQRVVNLPLDVMSQAGVREEDIFSRGGEAPGLKDAVFAVATRASDHLITARTLLKDIKALRQPDHDFEHAEDEGHEYASTSARQQQGQQSEVARKSEVEQGFGVMMGPAVSTQLWLDRLQKVDFDIFDKSLRMTEWKLPVVAWWKNRNMEF